LGDHLRRNSILADGEVSAREAEHVMWDVIVVGTGMGGGMLGYSLARSGRKVLFVEKGRSTLPGTPGTIRSATPEVAEPLTSRSTETYYDALARAGRSTDEIEDISGRFSRRYPPGIGTSNWRRTSRAISHVPAESRWLNKMSPSPCSNRRCLSSAPSCRHTKDAVHKRQN
jgi:choline dehydrogenase-like flavoprotein